jgi:hypothetical protein
MSENFHFGRLRGTVADVVDAGIDVLPHFEMAVITLLEGAERPAEWPQLRRRLRAEGVRIQEHRGALLLGPGDLERLAAGGMLAGGDELYLCAEWNDEFEPFPQRLTNEDFDDGTPLGLEEWMQDCGVILAVGDAAGVNFATLDAGLAERLRARFPSRRG